MTTLRQIEKLWNSRAFSRLFNEIAENRPDAAFPVSIDTGRSCAAAAMAIIRLDELNQSHVPFAQQLLRSIFVNQDTDGGWGDAATTALCLRALFCCGGNGNTVDRGLNYLANLQKSDGLWPKIPLRRMPADLAISAYVLFQLGDNEAFRQAVRFADALDWFETNEPNFDSATEKLWHRAALRCHVQAKTDLMQMSMWS